MNIQEFKVVIYSCAVEGCMKEYYNKFNLKRHISICHLKSNLFICNTCGVALVCKKNLREHMFIHSGIKPYKCTYCGKKFRQLSQLTLHRRIHGKRYKESLIQATSIDNNTAV